MFQWWSVEKSENYAHLKILSMHIHVHVHTQAAELWRTKVEEWCELCEDGVWGDGGRAGEGLQDSLYCLNLPTKMRAGGDNREETVI